MIFSSIIELFTVLQQTRLKKDWKNKVKQRYASMIFLLMFGKFKSSKFNLFSKKYYTKFLQNVIWVDGKKLPAIYNNDSTQNSSNYRKIKLRRNNIGKG